MNKALQERIEKLKDPKRAQPWSVLTLEELSLMLQAGKENMLTLYRDGSWKPPIAVERFGDMSYILKPDYEPKPEYEDIEIKPTIRGWLQLVSFVPTTTNSYSLKDAMDRKEFIGFYGEGNQRVPRDEIASRICDNEKVIARFVKE